MIEAVVFDFDGVIVDSEPLHLRTYRDVLAPLGLALGTDEYYAEYLGFDDEEVFRSIGEAAGTPFDRATIDALIHDKTTRFQALASDGHALYPGAAACIARLGARRPLGIASGALRHEIEMVLRATHLADWFRFIVAAGDTPRSKPAPDPYRRAAELHGVEPSRCVAIEDSHWGLESARAAGLRTIAVAHTYPAGALGSANLVVASLDELTWDAITRLD